MYEVLIWGITEAYDKLRKFLDISKIKINALVSSYDECIKSLDGIDVIKPEEIKNFNYDFIIVASFASFDKIVEQGVREGGINREKFIPSQIFELNDFDIDRYISIKNKSISIVSDNCWGSIVFKSLGLKYNSPFANLFIDHEHYLNLISNLDYYLKLPLKLVLNEYGFIEGYLENVKLNFVHDLSEYDILSKWNRRLKRFNFQNYLVKMDIHNDKEAYKFEDLKLKTKIGFYYKDLNLDSIIYIENWKDMKLRHKYKWDFSLLMMKCVVRNNINVDAEPNEINIGNCFNRYYDIFKLLNGEADFRRNIIYK